MMKANVEEGNQMMDATFDGEMTMADIDQRSTPSDRRNSPVQSIISSVMRARQEKRNSIEQTRATESDHLSPKSPELHHLQDANHSISERSADNDTTHDDYPSPQNGKTRKNTLKKPLKKKKTPVKKRVTAPRKAKKNTQPSQDDHIETTPVFESSSVIRGKVSQTRLSPPNALDSTPLRDQVLSSTSFKTSVAERNFMQSPSDDANYGR